MNERERQEQLITLRSELAEMERQFKYWMTEANRPKFSRRFRSFNEQTARHKAARYGDRIIELREQIGALEGRNSEAA